MSFLRPWLETPIRFRLSHRGKSSSASPRSAEALAEMRRARFRSGASCPRCLSPKIQRWGTFSGRQRWRCSACRRTFSDFTGTPFAYCKRPELWGAFFSCLARGLTVRACGRRLGVDKGTAWRWRHLVLEALSGTEDGRLSGLLEVDAIAFYQSRKGCRQLDRPAIERGEWTLNLLRDRVWVLLALDRSGTAVGRVTGPQRPVHPGRLAAALLPRTDGIAAVVAPFQWRIPLRSFCRESGALHLLPTHHRLAAASPLHRRNVRAFACRLRNWLKRFRGVATRYLARYLCWHRFHDLESAPRDLLLRTMGRLPAPACADARRPHEPAG